MAHGQQIDTSTVKQAGDNLDAFANQVTARLNKIKSEVEQLSQTYKGQGSNAFQQSMANWDTTALNIRRAIIELAGQVRTAGTQHTQGDASTVDGFRSATSGTSYIGQLGG
jgi:WXG100 family type VII secretion target